MTSSLSLEFMSECTWRNTGKKMYRRHVPEAEEDHVDVDDIALTGGGMFPISSLYEAD